MEDNTLIIKWNLDEIVYSFRHKLNQEHVEDLMNNK